MRIVLSIIATAALLASVGGCSRSVNDAASEDSYTVLDETGSQLRDDFNRYAGAVRLLFVVDPICGGCLRGMDDVNRALLAETNDDRLEVFVVHVPVVGGKAKHIARAATLLDNRRVHHYWNPSGEFGNQLAEASGMKNADGLVYAWDVWLIYGPDATWVGASPPQPLRLMHQLWGLEEHPEFPPLDGEEFGNEVHALLAQLPPSAPGATDEAGGQ